MTKNQSKSLLFFDFDGTLWFGKYHPGTVAAIKQLQSQGHLVVLNTGRSKGNLADMPNDIAFDGFCCGSTYVELGGKVLHRNAFSAAEIDLACKFANRDGVSVSFECEKGVCYFHPTLYPSKQAFFEHMRSFKDDLCTKVTLFVEKEFQNDKTLHAQIEQQLAPYFSTIHMPYYCELIKKGYDKTFGIKLLQQHTGISNQNTYAFGDSINDFAMIAYAGKGIVMPNAPDEVKKVASYVCATSQEGVAEGIKHYFKL